MTAPGEDPSPDYAERIAASAEVTRKAWRATLDDMEARAAALEAEGWETLSVPAGDTAPESPRAGDTDRFGMTHVVPDNYADEFREFFVEGGYPRYDVHRAEQEGRAFLLTTLLDPERERAILIAGSFELRHAPNCARAAVESGRMYTHVQTLDGTHLGSFEHDGYGKFFPRADRYLDDGGDGADGTDGSGDASTGGDAP